MKKMSIILVIFMLFTLVPVDIAKADTESVPNPTLVVGYNAKKKSFTLKLNHTNKNAKIYYRYDRADKFKAVKPGTTIILNTTYLNLTYSDLQVYAQIGKKKGKAKWYNIFKLIESQTQSRIKKEAKALVNEGDDSVCRFMKLIVWFQDKYRYKEHQIGDPWYDGLDSFYKRNGNQYELCYIFARYCEAIGIKVQCMPKQDYLYFDYTNPNYASGFQFKNPYICHVFLDKYPILVDPYMIVEEGALYNGGALDKRSYNKSKYKFNFTKRTQYKSFDYDEIIDSLGMFDDEKSAYDCFYVEGDVLGWVLKDDDDSFPVVTSIKIENNLVEINYKPWEPEYEGERVYTKKEIRYDPEDGYWYGTYWSADGKLLRNDKEDLKKYKEYIANK